jgi:hypothetical protein
LSCPDRHNEGNPQYRLAAFMASGGCARVQIAVQIARHCSLAAIRAGGKVRS